MQMTPEEAYLFVFKVMADYWKRTKNKTLGKLLEEFNLMLIMDGLPNLAPAWPDWCAAVKKVTEAERLSEEEAIRALVLMFEEYCLRDGLNLNAVIKSLKKQYDIA